MLINSFFILIGALFLVVKGATLATKYAALLAKSYRLSEYTVGFIIVAIVSVLPELFIAVNAAISGMPSFGLGMLLGSNVADLTLIFALIILFAGRGLKVESKILKNNAAYPFMLLLPLVLGLNGHFSRLEGLALVLVGGVFYYLAFKHDARHSGARSSHDKKSGSRWKSVLMLGFSMALLLVGAHFTVDSAISLAGYVGISPTLIAMLVVGLGTTMPELFFSLESVRERDDALAVGDILGTVLADATIVVGLIALISPFSFPRDIIYVTGVFMVIAAFVLFHFMRSGRTLTKREAWILFTFWMVFVLVEFIVNR